MGFYYKIAGISDLKKKLENLGRGLTKKEADEIGEATVNEMKSLISRGLSPVRGGDLGTRFPPYKNPKKYPGKKKPHTPVNLKLKGDFLDDLQHVGNVERAGGFAPVIGYSDPKQRIKERGHREGANDQPRRPTIPHPGAGERFAPSIIELYRKLILEALRRKTR